MRIIRLCVGGTVVMLIMYVGSLGVEAQTSMRELKEKIQKTSSKIEELEEGIAKDEANLNRLAGEKETLASTISQLNYSAYKLNININQTEEQITQTALEINDLSTQIARLTSSIGKKEAVVAQTLREIHQQSDTGTWEALLRYPTFSDFVDSTHALAQRNEILALHLELLQAEQESLESNTQAKQQAHTELEDQQESLEDRKILVNHSRQSKENLLETTKNQESNFQNSLAAKQQALREFELRMQQIERELSIAIDESLVQQKLVGLFSWPFAGNYRITQFFGNTSYARGGAYNGRGHSGVDFGTPIGTPIVAAMDGIVMGSDDTGKHGATVNGVYRQCVSYGKWIVIDHQNGLSTRYGHLSLIKAQEGELIRRGQVIGYSGNSGISTGPHLHLSVAATQGVQIKKLGDVMATSACSQARAPITAANAYKDPFDYLPRPEFNLQEVELGDSGASVRNLQMMLKHERIFPVEISANGVYGPTTAAAVLAWQKKYRVDHSPVLEEAAGKAFTQSSIDRYHALF